MRCTILYFRRLAWSFVIAVTGGWAWSTPNGYNSLFTVSCFCFLLYCSYMLWVLEKVNEDS